MKIIFRFLAILLFFLSLTGCGARQARYDVQIDSISADTVNPKKTYKLIPGNKDTSTEDLYFKEYEQYVHRALHGAGYKKSDGSNIPDEISIFITYGISDPKTNIATSSRSVHGVTGYTTTMDPWGRSTQTPQYGEIGKTANVRSYNTFTRWMILDAYDSMALKIENKFSQVWKTTITSSGSSSDLRRVLPVLAGASIYYIGKNTGKQVDVTVHGDNDPVVLYVKGIQQQ